MSPPDLVTDRLLLRQYTDADAPRVLETHSLLDVVRWLDNPPWTPMRTLDEALRWVDVWRPGPETGPFTAGWAIEVGDTGVVAGTAMITPLPDDAEKRLQVGWHLHPDSGGQGYATEAARAVLDDAFGRGLGEVWCGMWADNEPSAGVATRLGLRDLGIRPDPWYGGVSHLFHSTRDEWLAAGEASGPTP